MGVFFARVGWFAAAAIAIAFMTHLMASGVLFAKETAYNDPVLVRDELSPNMHRLSGMIMVVSPCDELSVKTTKLSDTSYALIFTTWREPSLTCSDEWVPRSFREIVFAPAAGVNFHATLDNAPISVGVIPILPNSH